MHSITSRPKFLNICLVEYFIDSFKTFIIITIGPFMKASLAVHDFKYVRLFLLVNNIVSLSYYVRARG